MHLHPLNNDGPRDGGQPWLPEREEVELLLRIGLFSQDDEHALRGAWRILQPQTDDYLEVVLGMAAAYPPLAGALLDAVGGEGLAANADVARRRFRRWLYETCNLSRDPPWLRQLPGPAPALATPAGLDASEGLPPFRYLIALAYPLAAAARPLLTAGGRGPLDVERMQAALLKAILLQAALLAKRYMAIGRW